MTLRDEIRDQPFVFEHLLDSASGRIQPVAAALAGTFNYVVIAARGTSDKRRPLRQVLMGGPQTTWRCRWPRPPCTAHTGRLLASTKLLQWVSRSLASLRTWWL